MQIFATYADPRRCAQILDDRRLNKAILESAQLICSAAFLNGIDPAKIPLKPTHLHHPLVLWCRKFNNAFWLYEHMIELCNEKDYRTGKRHIYDKNDTVDQLLELIHSFPRGSNRDEFINCTPFKDMPVHLAYRKLLRIKWRDEFGSVKPTNPRWRSKCKK